ncbi:MAG: DNA polymerase IV [Gammaproteobacteria bacterium]|nr:DNA polymerase IV [Gammaproteobacteria bacterium]
MTTANNSRPGPSVLWPRAIILVDMNCFFAAIEQLDFPELRGRPVAVTNGAQGTCIITSSYEARAYGVKTGMRLKEARRLCPDIIQAPARPQRYARISTAIMQSLQEFTPDVEVFSVDEAFLDITHCQRLLGTPQHIAQRVKQTVFAASGLLCSVGVSGDKCTAKFAAKLQKPDGLVVIPPWEARERLRNVPVTQLSGIKDGIGGYLAKHGVHVCGDMEKIPISALTQRFGGLGRRIWLMCQGLDPSPVITTVAPPKSLGHGKIMPPNTRDRRVVLTYLQHMSEKIGARLRLHQLQARTFAIGLRTQDGWIGGNVREAQPSNDGGLLAQRCREVLAQCWSGEGIFQVQITALDPQSKYQQLDLFSALSGKRDALNAVMDDVNRRYGEFTLAPANLLGRSAMPNVIAPAWKPYGHRQTI